MARIAFLTLGNMLAPYGDPAVEVFESAIEATYEQAEASPGYIRQLPDAEWVPGGDRLRSPYYTGGRSPELDAEAAPRVI